VHDFSPDDSLHIKGTLNLPTVSIHDQRESTVTNITQLIPAWMPVQWVGHMPDTFPPSPPRTDCHNATCSLWNLLKKTHKELEQIEDRIFPLVQCITWRPGLTNL